MTRLRQLLVCYRLQLRVMMFSPFEGFLQVFFPLMFATAALLVYRVNNDPAAMLYAGIGAAAMGIWTSQTTTAATLVQRERWAGTLELVVAAPTPFAFVVLPITFGMATLGLYSVVAVILWDWWLFDLPLQVESWPGFVLSILMATFSIALFGFLLSVTVVRYRTAWALGSALEYPGWLLCGFVVPLTVLPGWTQPLSWALAPTWGVEAMRDAAAGESPWFALAMCAAVGLAYAVLAAWLGERLIDSARRHATLSLT
ncbi:ABC transporter permease [Nocardioides eburneiflavus]|uniref:ABC transporter permease n=1 Tax=Nocardioides eburneiflavus TaxID=2518372 RepID=A0A4Z1C4E5_9ACTN|nr:ABC transporter permease [Nocardioides eburneiflavus]TGN63962.1 ABC transporter permease [Nocardioides eburneiflavus]